MKVCLFSQSLFALPLEPALRLAAAAGYEAVEVAGVPPHLAAGPDHRAAEQTAARLGDVLGETGLHLAALSLYSHFTDAATLAAQLAEAVWFMDLCGLLGTRLLKLTPGPPGSAAALPEHWSALEKGLGCLAAEAEDRQLTLAFETHMRQLTDTLASSLRLVEAANAPCVGLTVDYSNLAFAGEDVPEAARLLLPHTGHVHAKNGHVAADGSWRFGPLDQGLTDYPELLPVLAEGGYAGYLSIECLGPDAVTDPRGTIVRDRQILESWLGAKERP